VHQAWALLADEELYRGRSGTSQYMLLMAVGGAVVLALVGYYLWNTFHKKRDRRGEDATSGDILAELCRVHELGRAEQALISAVARNERLAQPASVFIDPGPFDRAAEGADPDAPRYGALREKLFGAVD
jgi:hypothetical protein